MIDLNRLRQLLLYDPATGEWRWLVHRNCNARAGDVAGTINSKGYRVIHVDHRVYKSSRLAWLYMTGQMPVRVDHRNRNKTDDTWTNLRLCTQSQNVANHPRRGVTMEGKRYVAIVKKDGKRVYRVSFPTFDEARAAYVAAKQRIYGEFAP